MRSDEYRWWKPSFAEYNRVQSAVIPFCDKDVNLIVAAPTAVGKTAIAECSFGYHIANGQNCVYLCPFRAIANEKERGWAKTSLASNGISVWNGDSINRNIGGLVIATLEAFDFALKSHYNDEWMKSVKCLVLDEAHILGDVSRGSVAENVLMEVSSINPDCRFILLSATMGNSKELASWVKSLNGKQTKCVNSNWRPIEVVYKIHSVHDFKSKIETTIDLIKENPFVKTLVFVQSKKTGSVLVDKLRANGIRTVFHNASVKPGIRKKMEMEFNDPFSGLDVLISTATLGAGVNIG